MTSPSERIGKLRRMAEHPTSNPHEAEIARKEMERLRALGHVEKESTSSWETLFRGADDFASRIREAHRRNATCWICGIRLNPGWVDSVSWHRCPAHLAIKSPGMVGYYTWARGLAVGDKVLVRENKQPTEFIPPVVFTIERTTATQYVMNDGARFRRTGKFPGYKVGEDGRDGRRHYMVAVTMPATTEREEVR